MSYKQLEKRLREEDQRKFDLPALLVWIFIIAAFGLICWAFFATATAPEPQYP